jgi:non-ribosomal peptide synthetase component E (peptide arylation enzyme)
MLEGCTPWPSELAARYRARGYWRDEPLSAIVERGARAFGEREALTSGDQRLSYRALEQRAEHLAQQLWHLGLRPRDRIVVHLNNTPEFVVLYFACAKVGVLPIMALLPHRLAEVRYLAEFSGAVAYVGPGTLRGFDFRELARQLREAVPGVRLLLTTADTTDGDVVSIRRLLSESVEPRPLARPDADEVALFLLSGGTTGLPKLIPRTHNDYEYNSRGSGEVCGIGSDTVYLVVLPISHNFPLASPGLQSVLQARRSGRAH